MTEPHGGTRNDIVARLARAQLGRKEDDARKAILRGFAEEGRAPTVYELAHVLGVAVESVREACRTLAGHDLIVWRDDEACIVSAYPFSGLPTAHQVLIEGDRTLYAMCAIDALGIPFMLGQGGRIRSSCFFCQKPVHVNIQDSMVGEVMPATLVVWFSDRDGCCIAEVRCPLMNFFCDEAHLQAWLRRASDEQGMGLSLIESLDVGRATFGGLLS
jgi:hypothetical protein